MPTDTDAADLGAARIARALRAEGWAVAVHNDYRLRGRDMTFWLWTHATSGRFIKGEGESDTEALAICAMRAWPGTYMEKPNAD